MKRNLGSVSRKEAEWIEEMVLGALRAAGAERGRWWTIAEWRKAKLQPSVEMVRAVSGSWGKAWTNAGFPPPSRWRERPRRRWSEKGIVKAVRRAAAGQYLSSAEYIRMVERGFDGPTMKTVQNHLGSWSNARRMAGIPPKSAPSESELLDAVTALWQKIGRPPKAKEWSSWGERPCSLRVLRLTLKGSWSVVIRAVHQAHPDLPVRSLAVRRLLAVPEEILTERERLIAQKLKGGLNLAAIGKDLGLSRERVRQIALRGGRRHPPRNGGRERVTREAAVTSLRAYFAEHGQIPTIERWMRERRKPSFGVIYRLFGNWEGAWRSALGSGHPALAVFERGGGQRERRGSTA